MSLKNNISLLAIACSVSLAQAQNGVNTPYSRYGFGIAADRAMGFNKSMAGTAQGFRDGQIVNVANPASYSAVDSLTALFDLGFSGQLGNLKMSGLSQNVRNVFFDYAAMHFRAAKGLGMTVSLQPITNIGYSFATTEAPVPGTEDLTSQSSFNGKGGLHQVMYGIGWQIFKPLSIGVNVGYIWGDYEHNSYEVTNSTTSFTLNRTYSADISTYNLDFGLQYTQKLTQKDNITLGVTYTLGHSVGSSAYCVTQSRLGTVIKSENTDTIKSAFEMPHQIAAGLVYSHNNSIKVGVDFELQKWSQCKFPYHTDTPSGASSFQSERGMLNDRMRISAGASWLPNQFSARFVDNVTYKIGAYYSNSYAKADLTGAIASKPVEFGISAGVSIPISNKHLWYNSPKVNVAFQWTQSRIPYLNTAMSEAKLTENYFRISVGMTFSERWFFKWKVN